MEAMRYVGHPKDGKITIELPDELKTQEEVEIIVLPHTPYKEKAEQKKSFDPRKFRGAAKLNMTPDEIDHHCSELRDEWERDI